MQPLKKMARGTDFLATFVKLNMCDDNIEELVTEEYTLSAEKLQLLVDKVDIVRESCLQIFLIKVNEK